MAARSQTMGAPETSFPQRKAERRFVLLKSIGFHHFHQGNANNFRVGNLDTDKISTWDGGLNTNAFSRQCQRQVILQATIRLTRTRVLPLRVSIKSGSMPKR